jgi:hypothetical protein
MRHHQPSASEIMPDPAWPDCLQSEFRTNLDNARVGTQLLSESERVRVWHLEVRPGERLPVHRHVLDYSGPPSPRARGDPITTTGARSRWSTVQAIPSTTSSGRASS